MSDDLKEGWARPSNSRKFHYFGEDRRSLCGKWAFFGEIEADDGELGLRDCAACDRRLRARLPRQAPKEQGETP